MKFWIRFPIPWKVCRDTGGKTNVHVKRKSIVSWWLCILIKYWLHLENVSILAKLQNECSVVWWFKSFLLNKTEGLAKIFIIIKRFSSWISILGGYCVRQEKQSLKDHQLFVHLYSQQHYSQQTKVKTTHMSVTGWVDEHRWSVQTVECYSTLKERRFRHML